MKILDNKIKLKLALAFIPVAYFSFFFHELGHWIIGELLGNDMVLRLNGVSPKSGQYLENTHLYILFGGVGVTVLLAIISWLIIEKYKKIYAFPVVFFNFFFRLFPMLINFNFQDEAKIAALLGIGKYIVAIIVLILLLLIAWRSARVLKLNYRDILLCLTASLVSAFLVVATDMLLFNNFYQQA